tara:strand:+ start:53975 stop:54076 length:102 start_codon:yes stop_codon:yes gene_type:complete
MNSKARIAATIADIAQQIDAIDALVESNEAQLE